MCESNAIVVCARSRKSSTELCACRTKFVIPKPEDPDDGLVGLIVPQSQLLRVRHISFMNFK